jgi:hypothetical protein
MPTAPIHDMMPDAPFDELTAQHQEMTPLLDRINATVEVLVAEPQASSALKDLNGALSGVRDLWHPHIRVADSLQLVQNSY